MKKWIKKYVPPLIIRWGLMAMGIVRSLASWPGFLADFWRFNRASKGKLRAKFSEILPMFGEATSQTGFDHHYIYHPAWAARIVAKIKPQVHVDISSTLHFSTLVSAFVPVKFYDYRPAKLTLSNLETKSADLVNLPFADNSIASLSCMHTVEHVGLGRYGDKLDPEGDKKAMAELKRVTAKGGSLLFVVPIGKPKIIFNAHRIYSYDQIMDYFAGFKLKNFALITDDNLGQDFIDNATKEQSDRQNYGCGCFWFIKPM